MVFNSFEFIFLFLPAAYLGFLLVHRVAGWTAVYPYLAVVSLMFYAQFSPVLALILVASVLVNYGFGSVLLMLRGRRPFADIALAISIAANLAALGYFKYMNFFLDVVNAAAHTDFAYVNIILPVGISFYTFIQIGFLVEARMGQMERPSIGRYFLFATFFPCVTAGPLVLQREMFDQMKDRTDPAFSSWRVAIGLTMFGMGLFKKVVLADAIAPYANVAFDGVAAGAGIDPVTAWAGALCYTLQLYFDFSGYSDMAIGLGYLFGIKLPLNFNSPLKATSITDFWRRWHMTMTRFFTSYIYTPLAMKNTRKALQNRYGPVRRFLEASALPVVYTFLIAGIWHGAGYTFVIYGLIHGFALAINHGWREFKMPSLPAPAGWALTMSVVVTGLVVFRAPDVDTAGTMLLSMWTFGLLGAGGAVSMVELDLVQAAAFILVFGAIVLTLPNTQEILREHWVSSDPEPEAVEKRGWQLPDFRWSTTPVWATATAACFAIAITSIGANSTFLYYQF